MTCIRDILSLRRYRPPDSIRARLTLWYVALLAVTVVAYSAILMVSLARGLDAGLDRLLNDEARQASALLGTVQNDQELRQEFRRLNVGTVVGLYDAAGTRLIAGRALPPLLAHAELTSGSTPRVETRSLPDGTTWRVLTLEAEQADQPTRLLVVARSQGFAQVAINQLLVIIGVTAPLTLLLAMAGGAFLTSRALEPIAHITRTAKAIDAEDLSRRLGLHCANDEVGRMAVTFDHMLERLDGAFERQRRFTADASHELRTPLAMLVSRAGMALERPRTPAQYQDALRAIRDDGLRMARMVNDLLMLARADAGDTLAVTERLDAGELVRSVADAMTPLATERGIALTADADDDVVLDGDQTRLTQLLVNLVDNAFAHTNEGGSVRLCAGRQNGFGVLRVSDTGTGIPPEDLPHVFQRFFRVERGRGRDRGGAGLGLSLCKSIALAHGGDISLESVVGRGTSVTVSLPIADERRASSSIHSHTT